MWDTKYRPLTFGDVLGQQGAVQLLKARLALGNALDTNYIFAGGHGQGKTTLARILARAMLCLSLDKGDPEPCNQCDNCLGFLSGDTSAYEEADAASNGTVADMRVIVGNLPFAVLNAPKRVYVFDEAHRMSKDAQDVLLKPLEERKLVGIFCTTEPESIRGAIRSRCEEYAIRKITREDILERMKRILTLENVEHDDEAVLTVIDYSKGHVRDVLNRLEMVSQMGAISQANVRRYLDLAAISAYYEILLSLGDMPRALQLIEETCDRVGPEEVSSGLAEAAMNSFRLARGMFTDMAYMDKGLAQKVYAVYGDRTVALAQYLLQSRNPSRVSLICDVLHLGSGVPAPAQVTSPFPVVVPPLRVSPGPAAVPEAQPPAAPAAPVASAVVPDSYPEDEYTAEPEPSPPAAPAPPVAPPVAPAPPKPPSDLDARGVGNLGSSDIAALTTVDLNGIKKVKPRGRQSAPPSLAFVPGAKINTMDTSSPEQWRREFEMEWLGSGYKGGSSE